MQVADMIGELKMFYKDGVHYRTLDRHLTEEDVERWVAASGWSRSRLFDEIAARLALGFNGSELSFEFCDAVVNDLFGPVTNTSGLRPMVFWEVNSAFDEGEYYHDNNREEDSVDLYTRSTQRDSDDRGAGHRESEMPFSPWIRPTSEPQSLLISSAVTRASSAELCVLALAEP
jgi:hypothetical protein